MWSSRIGLGCGRHESHLTACYHLELWTHIERFFFFFDFQEKSKIRSDSQNFPISKILCWLSKIFLWAKIRPWLACQAAPASRIRPMKTTRISGIKSFLLLMHLWFWRSHHGNETRCDIKLFVTLSQCLKWKWKRKL
jgi:hypothetical protein